jgi:hypothetical protein
MTTTTEQSLNPVSTVKNDFFNSVSTLNNDVILSGIAYDSFRHPLDQKVREGLKNFDHIKKLVEWFENIFAPGQLHYSILPNSVEVELYQFPRLWEDYIQLTKVLSIDQPPRLFIQSSPQIHAISYRSGDTSFICVYTGLAANCTRNELLGVIGHELGHIKSEDLMYAYTAQCLLEFGTGFFQSFLPPVLGFILNTTATLSLLAWYRAYEYSCDRASLLATQNLDAACGWLAKSCGFCFALGEPVKVDAFHHQAQEFRSLEEKSYLSKALKLFFLSQMTHPYPVDRVIALQEWGNSEEYKAILQGNYRRELNSSDNNPKSNADYDQFFKDLNKF